MVRSEISEAGNPTDLKIHPPVSAVNPTLCYHLSKGVVELKDLHMFGKVRAIIGKSQDICFHDKWILRHLAFSPWRIARLVSVILTDILTKIDKNQRFYMYVSNGYGITKSP